MIECNCYSTLQWGAVREGVLVRDQFEEQHRERVDISRA